MLASMLAFSSKLLAWLQTLTKNIKLPSRASSITELFSYPLQHIPLY